MKGVFIVIDFMVGGFYLGIWDRWVWDFLVEVMVWKNFLLILMDL